MNLKNGDDKRTWIACSHSVSLPSKSPNTGIACIIQRFKLFLQIRVNADSFFIFYSLNN